MNFSEDNVDEKNQGLLNGIKKDSPFISFFVMAVSIISLVLSITILSLAIYKYAVIPEQPKGLHWSIPYNFTYPLSKPLSKNFVNSVVSFSNDGEIELGGGISIQKTVYTENYAAHHLKVASRHEDTLIVASDDSIRVYTINENDTIAMEHVTPLKDFSGLTDLVRLTDDLYAVLNHDSLLPFTVQDDNIVTLGQPTTFESDKNTTTYFDRLDDTCVVIVHSVNYNVMASVACRNEAALKMNIVGTVSIAKQYGTFAVAGMNSTYFIVGYTDSKIPTIENSLFFASVKRNLEDNSLKVKSRSEYSFHYPLGPFDMDNFNEEIAIATFVDAKSDTGLVALMLRLDPYEGNVSFGTYFSLQDGGASGREPDETFQFIEIRILSDSRFGVFYSNFLDEGAMCFIMCEVTPALDIIQLGNEYVLTKPLDDVKHEFYYAAEAYATDSRFYLVDSLMAGDNSVLNIHIGEVHNNPIGLCIDQTEKDITIAIAGTVNTESFAEPLEVGRLYYANYLGQLVKGPYFGTDVIEGITTYVNTDSEILSMNNLIGYAVSSNKLYIEPKESLN